MAFGQLIDQRKLNKRNHVVDMFREHGALSKARVRQLSGYSMDTLIGIFKSLEDEGYVRALGAGEEPPIRDQQGSCREPEATTAIEARPATAGTEAGATGRAKGRPPEFYCLDDERDIYLGTTFNQSGIYSVLVGFSGLLLDTRTDELQGIDDQVRFEAAFVRHFLAFLSANSRRIPRIRRVGLALPGQHDAEKGILFHYSLMPFLKDFDLGALVRRHLSDIPLTCRHNVAGLARCILKERELVACHDRILYVSARAGAAHALIQEGKILLDNGEMGHIRVSSSNRRCECGRKGCLDTVFSAKAFRSLLPKWPPATLADDLAKEKLEGGGRLRNLIEPGYQAFSEALLDLSAAFSPDLLVLSGEMLAILPDPVAWIRDWMSEMINLDHPPSWFPKDILFRPMGSEAAAIGLCHALIEEDWMWQAD
ncbi:MAG: ROK family protein [Treponema sp.]|nr:ROK family protein [Treponema sp.]